MNKLLAAVLVAASAVLPGCGKSARPTGKVERRDTEAGIEVSSPYYSLLVPKPWTVSLFKDGSVNADGGVSYRGVAGLWYVDVEPGSIDDSMGELRGRMKDIEVSPEKARCVKEGKTMRCLPAGKDSLAFAAVLQETGPYTVVFWAFTSRFPKDVLAMADSLKIKELR